MLVALVLWVLSLVGVAPSSEQLLQYEELYRNRVHHFAIDLGSTQGASFAPTFTLGLAYEFLLDRAAHALSFETLVQGLFGASGGTMDLWAGGGIGYYPVRQLKIFVQSGIFSESRQQQARRLDLRARLGVGYQSMFFALAVMPFFYGESTSDGRFSWNIGARFQY